MRTAVVGGASRGIGRATAEALSRDGWLVVVVARDRAASEEVVRGIRERGGDALYVEGDVGCNRTTRALARDLLDACPRIDLLVHVAGIWPAKRELNEDGLEKAFAVNHVAPFLLNHLIEERLFASSGRVVQVSAGLYIKGRVDLAKTPTGEDFHALRTYANTKLANVMLVPRFAERWGDRASIVAVHPGVIRTGLGDRGGLLGALLRLVKRTWKSPEEGARPVVRLADAVVRSGTYFHEGEEQGLLPIATDAALVEALWNATATFAGIRGAEGHDADLDPGAGAQAVAR